MGVVIPCAALHIPPPSCHVRNKIVPPGVTIFTLEVVHHDMTSDEFEHLQTQDPVKNFQDILLLNLGFVEYTTV